MDFPAACFTARAAEGKFRCDDHQCPRAREFLTSVTKPLAFVTTEVIMHEVF